MKKQFKLIIAGTLLAVTAFAISFLAFSLSGSASATSSNAQTQAQIAQQPVEVAAQPDLATTDQNLNDLLMLASSEVTGTAKADQTQPKPLFGMPGFDFKSNGSEVQGILTKVENNGSKLTVGSRVVNLNDQTTLGDASGTLKKEDLKTGDRLMAIGKAETDQSLTARWVLRLAALPTVAQGVFDAAAADGKSFTFKLDRDNSTWTATVTDQTVFRTSTQTGKLSDFKAGDKIAVVGKADEAAKKIEASVVSPARQFVKPGPPTNRANFNRGTIKSLDTAGNSLVISQTSGSNQPATDLKIVVDSSTTYKGTNLKSLTDLKVGDTIIVQGDKQTDGSLKAKTIVRGPAGGRNTKTGNIDSQFFSGQADAAPTDPDFLFSQAANDPNFYSLG